MTKNKTVKIKTTYGKILTLTISKETKAQISGTDKFGATVIIPMEDIHSLVPLDDGRV